MFSGTGQAMLVISALCSRGLRGEFQGIPPTGKQVTISAIGILRITSGRIAETWLNADFLGLMQQLGVVPAPAQAVGE